MRTRNRLSKSVAITLSCLGILVSQSATFAANPPTVKTARKSVKASINDVALGANGTLSGRIIDEQGYPLSGASVIVHQGKKVFGKAVTDKLGAFHISPLRAGVYQVTAGASTEVYRIWAENTAPPAARKGLLMVAGDPVVRGQFIGGGLSTANVIGLGLGITGVTLGTIALKKNRDTQRELDKLAASLAGTTP